MATPTSAEPVQPKKSNTMLYAAVVIVVIIIAGAVSYFAFFSGPSTFTPTVTFHLKGNALTGWNDSTPGPQINVTMNDKVRIVLISEDGNLHNFVIAYSGNAPSATPAASDRKSPDFSSTTTSINFDFTPSQTGTFKYYCQYHYTVMVGTIKIT